VEGSVPVEKEGHGKEEPPPSGAPIRGRSAQDSPVPSGH